MNSRILKTSIAGVLAIAGVVIMFSRQTQVIELNWEWPAHRMVTSTMPMRIANVSKQGKGLFGMGRSPSLVENLPDPLLIQGEIIAGNRTSQRITLILPSAEFPATVKAGDIVSLHLLDEHTCIGIEMGKSGK